ncbi:MAG: YbjQ family protein [Gemmatimonadota bacterium]|nr:YbjQ family protein [Gemmatimonadota bacterium]MDE2781652.1 YbjQ family protein [Gemmatimonadota bacterium]MDE2865321.1 YbjQ family protein [Gemmatimonadota bacterium]MXV96282.1 YbjQ family protein [Gemmatimonadota bacterium]MXX54921.1 YbjQ family protein [Gemmatimonadota bacterium]
MIVATTETVAGYRVTRTLGLVRGSSVRVRHLGQDLIASLRNIAGGEVFEYTKLLAEVREQSVDRMIADAEALGANGILCVRFQSAEVSRGGAEMMCYGTAVELRRADQV